MSARYRWGLVAALILQLVLLGWIIVDRAMLLANGREVRFAVLPVDPRDIFRGDYVILNYAFSRLLAEEIDGDDNFNYQDTVYVTLAESDGEWQAVAVSHTAPAEGIFLRGTIANVSVVETNDGDDCAGAGCTAYDIDYGIEQFFVPGGTGRELETLRNGQRLSVDVAIGNGGQAALKRLLVDDEVRYDEPFY